jgi:PBP1b-binding outer membrane lipoprotein LpoB
MGARIAIIFLLLALAGCSTATQQSPQAADQAKSGPPRRLDFQCLNDCLGSPADEDLCRARCTY